MRYDSKGMILSWQTFLFNHFLQRISSSEKKILVDTTALCLMVPFIESLVKRNVKYTIIDSPMGLMQAVNSDVCLIIADQSRSQFSIPETAKTFYQTIVVDYNTLPFNIDYSLYQDLSKDELLSVLEFSSQSPTEFITSHNVKNILEKSLQTRVNKKNMSLEQIFNEFIKQPEDLTYDDILKIGALWGEYVSNCYQISKNPDRSLLNQIDFTVSDFIIDSGLKNLPYEIISNFKSVERICGYLKHIGYEKNALLCFDGMGWAEWLLLKQYLLESFDIDFKEKAVFSMIPSTTKISRSTIFSGRINQIYQTKYPNEKKAWKENFQNAALFKNSDKITENSILGYTTFSKIYNIFDETAHKTIIKSNNLSKNTYFRIVEQYLQQAEIINEIEILVNNGFQIFICSDHGCTIAKGNGHKIEKHLIDSYSKRGTIVKDKSVLNNNSYIKYQVPIAEKPNVILAAPGEMFDYESAQELTHGGTSVEEIVIPFIEIKEINLS